MKAGERRCAEAVDPEWHPTLYCPGGEEAYFFPKSISATVPLWHRWNVSRVSDCPSVPGEPGFGVSLGARRPTYRVPPRLQIFDDFLTSSWDPNYQFWCQLTSNLLPYLGPKSTQIRPKRAPNSKPTCMMFSMPCFIDFGTYLVDFWKVWGGKLSAKLTEKSTLEGKAEKTDFLVFAEAKIKT